VTITCLVDMIRTFVPLRERTSHDASMRHWRRVHAHQQNAEHYNKLGDNGLHNALIA
jgi:hypothetical protein